MEEIKDKVMEEKAPEEKKPELPKRPERKQKKSSKDFVSRKLAVINNMSNPAKARRLAERVLANKRKAVK